MHLVRTLLCGIGVLNLSMLNRAPIVVFLSDGECSLADVKVQDICRAAVARGCVSSHLISYLNLRVMFR